MGVIHPLIQLAQTLNCVPGDIAHDHYRSLWGVTATDIVALGRLQIMIHPTILALCVSRNNREGLPHHGPS